MTTFIHVIYYALSFMPVWYVRRFYNYTYEDYDENKVLDKKRNRTWKALIICMLLQGIIFKLHKHIPVIERDYRLLIASSGLFIFIYAFHGYKKLYPRQKE